MASLALVSAGGVELVYMTAALLFILGLKRLSGVKTARSGNALSSIGMALAIGATMFLFGEVHWAVLVGGVVLGHEKRE